MGVEDGVLPDLKVTSSQTRATSIKRKYTSHRHHTLSNKGALTALLVQHGASFPRDAQRLSKAAALVMSMGASYTRNRRLVTASLNRRSIGIKGGRTVV